ncbi:MAG: NADH dehydrogenase/nad(p)h [Geobacteraceae bacterium]|nr:MAG: NADH dehydrogenase/nad(p)h [Geobacteraceae bacterium]
MDALEAILTRRSIRTYKPQPIPEELITRMLEAAMSAPSAGNEQPWHFVVIKERQLLDAIPKFHPYAHMLHGAPAAILVCGDERLEKHKGFWTQDCAAATGNLLLAAHALGLGAVWVGVYPHTERVALFRDHLGIPEHVIPFSLVPLGYADEHQQPEKRYNPARVHHNRWLTR